MKKNYILHHLHSIIFVWHSQELSYDFHNNMMVFFEQGEFWVSSPHGIPPMGVSWILLFILLIKSCDGT